MRRVLNFGHWWTKQAKSNTHPSSHYPPPRKKIARRRELLGFEPLEDRRLLSAVPLAADDSAYVTPVNTALNVGGSASLLQNDWDPDGGTLGATIITNSSHGALSNLSSSAGTFTYTPDTDFSGIDRCIDVPDSYSYSYSYSYSHSYSSSIGLSWRIQSSVVYDARGDAQTVWLPDPDGTGSQARPWRAVQRDAFGRATAIFDQMGRSTEYAYDPRDRVVSSTERDPCMGPLAETT